MNHDDSLAQIAIDEVARQRRILEPPQPLFGAGTGSPDTDAWIGDLVSGDAAECDGFKEGAQQLLAVLKRRPELIDILVFPIVFCYRQYVELALKAIVREARANGYLPNARTEDVDRALKNHAFPKLWAMIIESFARCPFAPSNAEIDRATLRIEEWEAYDPASFAYRYARSKSGARRMLPTATSAGSSPVLDLHQFGEGMKDFAETLDSLRDKYDDMFNFEI